MDSEERITLIEANANPALWKGENLASASLRNKIKQIMAATLRRALEQGSRSTRLRSVLYQGVCQHRGLELNLYC
jgi:hypothetical protein